MAEQKQSNKGKPRSAGKHKGKYIAYFTIRMPRKKLRHILHNNGELAAYKWAVEHSALATLRQLAPKLEWAEMERRKKVGVA